MLLQPKNFKSKKRQKKRSLLNFNYNYKLKFGNVGLLLTRPVSLTSTHLSKLKLFLKRATRRGDKTKRKLWFNLFPHLPLTKKPANVRMGKGKGKLKIWFTNVRGGTVLFEYKNLRYGRSVYFFRQASFKLGVPTVTLHSHNLFFKFPMRSNRKIFFQSFWS